MDGVGLLDSIEQIPSYSTVDPLDIAVGIIHYNTLRTIGLLNRFNAGNKSLGVRWCSSHPDIDVISWP